MDDDIIRAAASCDRILWTKSELTIVLTVKTEAEDIVEYEQMQEHIVGLMDI